MFFNAKKIIYSGLFIFFFLNASLVFAQGQENPIDFLCELFDTGSKIAIALCSFAIIFGGTYYIISFSSGGFTGEGKEWVKAGILGFLIVSCSLLIAKTINPALISCSTINIALPKLDFKIGDLYEELLHGPSKPEIHIYDEIPIGKLSENLLSRKIDCFDFDLFGDPIDGIKESKNEIEPSLIENDRQNCLSQIIQGADKKIKIATTLIEKIKIMAYQCDCSITRDRVNPCTNNCSGCNTTGPCPGGSCTGSCVGSKCNPGDCCPADSKQKMEHGPVYLDSAISIGSNNTDILAISNQNNSQILASVSQSFSNMQLAAITRYSPQAGTIQSAISGAFQEIQSQISGANTSIRSQIDSAYYETQSYITQAGLGIQSNITQAGNDIQSNITRAGTDIQANITRAGTDIQANISQVSQQIQSAISSANNEIKIALSQAAQQIQSNITQAGNGIQSSVSRANSDINSSLSTAANQIHSAMVAAGAEINSSLRQADIDIQSEISQTNQKIQALISQAGSNIRSTISNANSGIQSGLNQTNSRVQTNMSDVNTQIQSILNRAASQTNPDMSQVSSEIQSLLSQTGTGSQTNWSQTAQEIQSQLSAVGNNTGNNIQDLKSQIQALLVDLLKKINAILSSIGTCTEAVQYNTSTIKYNGLDEFRCPNPDPKNKSIPCSKLPQYVEKQIKIDGKKVTVIDKEKWSKLNLWQQLVYFKEKAVEIKEQINKDKEELNKATAALGKCYLALPYSDLIRDYEISDNKKKLILVNKKFKDPFTSEPINVSNYCKGFGYENSNCFTKCGALCPDDSDLAVTLYRGCQLCKEGETDCLAKQSECINNAYNNRPCLYGDDPSQTFSKCMSSCQNTCADNCKIKYLLCSNEYNACKKKCEKNGTCLLNNYDKCLFNPKSLSDCATNIEPTSKGNLEFCIDNAYLCKNGSDEYSGYEDCAISLGCKNIVSEEKCKGKLGCFWDGANGCKQNYSSSFLFENKDLQLCKNPYVVAPQGSKCFIAEKPESKCQKVCPETSKCVSSSSCPECECGKIDESFVYKLPQSGTELTKEERQAFIDSQNCSRCANNGNHSAPKYKISVLGEYSYINEKISAYEIINSQCTEYSYNDDPLTFYCLSKPMWYDNPQREGSVSTPMGKERFCPLENEIPVGQTVDNSKKWVVDINSDIEKFEEVVQAVLDKMEKVGKMKDDPIVKDYCSCSARMITGERICASDCQFIQRQICPPGKACYWDCYCSVIPCKGPPCLQLLDYMTELWNACRDFELYYADINKKIIKNPSGDLLKQLTYSREKMSDCSLQNTIQGAISRVLSCERIKHEIIPPISGRNILFNENSYSAGCYGKGLNEFTPTSEVPTENWFCCEELTKDPRTSPNPIYNIRK